MKSKNANGAPPQPPSLRRALGVVDGVSILVGITIGAGIYSTPQLIAGYLGSFQEIILLWILVGAFVFIAGLVYAELGTRLPNTGGEYVYISRCFGPFAGFIFGWAQLFIIRTSPAAGLAMIAADYLTYFVSLTAWQHTFVALGIIAFFGVLNYVGIQRASVYQNLSTMLKVGGLAALVLAGLILMRGQENLLATRAAPTGTLGPIGNTVAAIMLIVFSHTGWDRLGYSAGEMKNPQRVLRLGLLIGVGVIVFLYVSTNTIYHMTLGMEGVRGARIVASDTATKLVGPIGAGLVAILVIVSTTGSINGTMMTATRVYYAMARDGLFFRWFAHIHPKYRTPSHAVIAHCVWAAVILLVRSSFETIVAGMVFALLIFYVMTTLALFKLRRENAGGDGVFRVPLYPVLPAVYLAGILALLVFRGWFEWEKSLVDVLFIATGIPFALFWTRMNEKTNSD